MSSKSLTQRQNIKLKKIIHGYSSVHLILWFLTYLPTYVSK
jgi:hypothetical protein